MHYSQLADIQAISITNGKYYESLKDRYKSAIMLEDIPNLPSQSRNKVYKAESEEARDAMRRAFRGQ